MHVKLKGFPGGTVSADGMSVTLKAEKLDGKAMSLELPADQLDWIQQALLSLSDGCYERQVATGKVQRGNPIDPAMVATAVRVLPNIATQQAIVQVTGRKEPNAPLGMGSFLVSAELVQYLGRRLLEVAEQLRQAHRPS